MVRGKGEFGDYEGDGGRLYVSDYPESRPGEDEWLTRVAGEEGDPICELACGHGRLLFPLARRGHTVVGVDRSHTLIQAAREMAAQEPPEVRGRLSFTEGDMRQFDLGGQFRYIFIFFGGFGYLDRAEDRHSCLVAVRRHLVRGGLLEIEDPTPGPESLTRDEMENHFRNAGLALESALSSHSLPLTPAGPAEPAVLYRLRAPQSQ